MKTRRARLGGEPFSFGLEWRISVACYLASALPADAAAAVQAGTVAVVQASPRVPAGLAVGARAEFVAAARAEFAAAVRAEFAAGVQGGFAVEEPGGFLEPAVFAAAGRDASGVRVVLPEQVALRGVVPVFPERAG